MTKFIKSHNKPFTLNGVSNGNSGVQGYFRKPKKSKKIPKNRSDLAQKYNRHTGGGSTFQPTEES